MKLSAEAFRQTPNKRVTLMGMSGVGKTRLSNILRAGDWFHYSVDYRIGTRYLDEAILDNLKSQMMQVPFLRDLLRSDSIYIRNNISVDNLAPLSTWLGKLGDPELGGLPLQEFKRRQLLHYEAEKSAVADTVDFMRKAESIYGYKHFLNDVSGSLCELDAPELYDQLAEHSVMIYIKADKADENMLIERAEKYPKPLFYREEFLNTQLDKYLQEKKLEYTTLVDPDDFVRWVFPHLFYARVPRYEAIADRLGYAISARDAYHVSNEHEFLQLIEHALDADSSAQGSN